MKLASWNVNGLRSVGRKGFLKWFEEEAADIVCVQEIKATPEVLEDSLRNPHGYNAYWHPAEKPGYSGVATFTKREPIDVQVGIGVPEFDREGRVLVTEFVSFVLINAYFPNSQHDHARLPFKLKFCAEMLKFCERLRSDGKNVIVCGDYNIAHRPIDLKNPKSNENNAGYLPEERAWMDEFTSAGYVDIFRHYCEEPEHYTWWSYRPTVRERNIGWRLDYHCVNQEFVERTKGAEHRPKVMGSDHCPVLLNLRG